MADRNRSTHGLGLHVAHLRLKATLIGPQSDEGRQRCLLRSTLSAPRAAVVLALTRDVNESARACVERHTVCRVPRARA